MEKVTIEYKGIITTLTREEWLAIVELPHCTVSLKCTILAALAAASYSKGA